MSEIVYQPNHGQCVCDIHRAFLAKHGYTVDYYYDVLHPEKTPWYMAPCGHCDRKAKAGDPIQVTQPVNQSVQPLEVNPMCNPTVHQSPCSTACARHQALLNFGNKLAVGALLGIVGLVLAVLTIGLAGLAFLAAAPIAAVIVLTWKYRYQLNDLLCDAMCLPFILAWRGVTLAAQAVKAHINKPTPAPAQHVRMLAGPVAITDRRRLLEMKPVDVIELPTQKQAVRIRKPRKMVQHGNHP